MMVKKMMMCKIIQQFWKKILYTLKTLKLHVRKNMHIY